VGAALVVVAAATACGDGSGSGGVVSPPTGGAGELVHVFSASAATAHDGTVEITMALHNAGTSPDRLTGVTCHCNGTARLVRTAANGASTPVSSVALPSEHVVILGPHGAHVDIAMASPVAAGETLSLELTFRRSAPVTAVVAAP
jgi:copper(I)-binding protein